MKPRTVADGERLEQPAYDAAVELTGTLECAYAMLSEFIKSVTIEEVN